MKQLIRVGSRVLVGAAILVATLFTSVPTANAAQCAHMIKMYGTSESSRSHNVHLSNGTTKTISTNGVVTAPSGTYFDGVYTHSGFDVWIWNGDNDVVKYYSATGWHYWRSECFNYNFGTVDEN